MFSGNSLLAEKIETKCKGRVNWGILCVYILDPKIKLLERAHTLKLFSISK